MNKKSQTEIMGLVMIVILITVIILFVIKFSVNAEPKTVKQDVFNQKLASNTLNVLLSTTTDCNKATITELLRDCAEYMPDGDIMCDTQLSCIFVNETIKNYLEQIIILQQKDYEFLFDEADINLTTNVCPGDLKQATANIPLRYGTKEIKLRICDKQT